MDNKQQAWAQFAASGRVADYLRFRMQEESHTQPTQEATHYAPEYGRPGHPGTEYR